MSAKAKLAKIASLWQITTLFSAGVTYFTVQSQTVTATLVGLAFWFGLNFLVHRMLAAGSGLVRKIVLVCNLGGMCLLPLGIAASAWSVSSAPLRSIFAISWMVWLFTLHFRSFSTLKDSDVKRSFA